jgi:two-component system phosphate regulon response regulator PhoB
MAKNILLVEDEAAIREMLQSGLTRAGFDVSLAADAAEAERRMKQAAPDLILLDWMLPGVSGLELARRLRRDPASKALPIIMLTARCDEGDRLKGFEAGADDYIGKPFSVRLDPVSHRVSADGRPVKVGPTEFRMLYFFMDNPERVFTRSQILDKVWGNNVYLEERTVDVHIRRLRKALQPHGYAGYVQTVHGTGYRFSAQQ